MKKYGSLMSNYFIRYYLPLLIAFLLLLLSSPVSAKNPRVRDHQIIKDISVDDIKAEIEFGSEVAARIIGKYGLYQDDDLVKYVNLIAKSLASAANRPEIRFTVGILSTNTINAFAAPGGFIFVTKGVIDNVDDEAQLAAVISHEIIHIVQKHIVKELNIRSFESSAVSGLTHLISGTTNTVRVAFTKAVDETINILFERGYKRRDEIEADTMGVVLASRLGYDPVALACFIEKIKNLGDEDISSYRNLYPPFDERIEHINKTIAQEGLTTENHIKEKLVDYQGKQN